LLPSIASLCAIVSRLTGRMAAPNHIGSGSFITLAAGSRVVGRPLEGCGQI
jgi:hypothetical protein